MTTKTSLRNGGYAISRAIAISLCVFLGATVSRVQAADVTDANVAEMVASAKTPEDHQALATYFQTKAAKAAEDAKMHERMLASFGGKPPDKAVWTSHCQNLIRDFRNQQADYEAMAKQQATIAKTLSGSHQ